MRFCSYSINQHRICLTTKGPWSQYPNMFSTYLCPSLARRRFSSADFDYHHFGDKPHPPNVPFKSGLSTISETETLLNWTLVGDIIFFYLMIILFNNTNTMYILGKVLTRVSDNNWNKKFERIQRRFVCWLATNIVFLSIIVAEEFSEKIGFGGGPQTVSSLFCIV